MDELIKTNLVAIDTTIKFESADRFYPPILDSFEKIKFIPPNEP